MIQSSRPRRVTGLGEVSIRVRDLDAMHKFYEEVVGLEVAAHRGLCQAGREFCVLQSRGRLWWSYTESRPL